MRTKAISITRALNFAFHILKKQCTTYVILLLIELCFPILFFLGANIIASQAFTPNFCDFHFHPTDLIIIPLFIGLIVGIAWSWLVATQVLIHIHQRSDLWIWPKFKKLFKYIPSAIALIFLYKAIVTVGFMLLIIPGVIAILTYNFVWYAMVDQKTDAWQSFSYSAHITKGHRLQLLLLYGVFFGMVFGFLELKNCWPYNAVTDTIVNLVLIAAFLILQLINVDIYYQLKNLKD